MSYNLKLKGATFILCQLLLFINLNLFQETTLIYLPFQNCIRILQACFLMFIQCSLYTIIRKEELIWIDLFQFGLLFLIVFTGYFNTFIFFTLVFVFVYYFIYDNFIEPHQVLISK